MDEMAEDARNADNLKLAAGRARNIAIVLSAGRGSRMHTKQAKQYLDLCGKPVIAWSLQAFEGFGGIDDVILVSAPDDIAYCRKEIVEKYRFKKVRAIVPGGAERYLSVWEGLKAASRMLDGDSGSGGMRESCILIHDGARPLVDGNIISRCLDDALRHGACVAAMPVKDTIKVADPSGFAVRTPDRRSLWQIQTPQAFSFSLVYEAYRKLIAEGITDVTDDAMVVERMSAAHVRLTEGSYRNIKITTPEDLEIAELFLRK
jgi:2-C-methyl-D-erythritol 4-phosphate cytidylyltransferase